MNYILKIKDNTSKWNQYALEIETMYLSQQDKIIPNS